MPVVARAIPQKPDPDDVIRELREQVENQAWILKSRESVDAFISFCFLEKKPQHWFHSEWQDLCDEHRKLVIFAPLEHAKTQQISVWRVLWVLGNNPEMRIWICSATSGLAKKVIAELQQLILTHERVQMVFPWLRPERRKGRKRAWHTTALIIERDNNWRDPSVFATGIMGQSLGSRVDMFVGDDMMNFRNTWYEVQRQKSVEWFKGAECVGRWTAQCRAVFINNTWHSKALAHVAASEMGFFAKRYEACDDNFEKILWPLETYNGAVVGFDEERLRDRFETMGPVEFGRCYRSKTINDSTEWFNRESMMGCMRKDLKFGARLPRQMLSICGVDPAVSKKKKTNDCVFFHMGVDPVSGVKRLARIVIGKMSSFQIVKIMLGILRVEPDTIFVVESNAQQGYLLQTMRTPEVLKACGATDWEVNKLRGAIVEHQTTDEKTDPEVGIPKMNADFEGRTWEVPECQEAHRWFEELLDYRPGTHTGDVAMASYLAWVRADKMSAGRVGSSLSAIDKFMDKMVGEDDLDEEDIHFGGLFDKRF